MTTFDPANPKRENFGVTEYGLAIYHELSTGTVRVGFDFGCDDVVPDACGGTPSVSASASPSASASSTTATERMDGPADAVVMYEARERERELPLTKLEPDTTPREVRGVERNPRSKSAILMVSVGAYIAEDSRLLVRISV
jgi:hypothetical protein